MWKKHTKISQLCAWTHIYQFTSFFKIDLLRLLFPQWQGAPRNHIQNLLPELGPDASSGYTLGAKILNFLSPANCPTIEVPISYNKSDDELKTENGIFARKPLLIQLQNVVKILQGNNPNKVAILGGECSVSVAPFSYLAKKYENDVVCLWYDAHPDITLPGDEYTGYHAMALSSVMGLGDQEFIDSLPGKIPTSRALIVGLRVLNETEATRIKELNLKSVSCDQVHSGSSDIVDWIKSTGCHKVVIHLDLDVLDPNDIFCAVGKEPNGLKLDEVVKSIKSVGESFDIVALTIAEHNPSIEIRLQNMMNELPLFH